MSEKNFPADLSEIYLLAGSTGEISTIEGGDKFWSLPPEELERHGQKWLIGEYDFDSDWPSWEMHPNGDEIVYLLSGAMDFILEENQSNRVIELRSKGLIIVPRGIWHTAKVYEPSRILGVTLGGGTRARSVE